MRRGEVMSKRILSKKEQQILSENKNVLNVTSKSITYRPEFKIIAVKKNLMGISPMSIFIEAGFDLDTIGIKQPYRCLDRWRRVYKTNGVEGLRCDSRGKRVFQRV